MRKAFLALAALLCALATPARAEWDLGLYAGASHTPKSDVTMVVGSASGPADHTFHDVKWDRSAAFGLHAGYWFGWYGVGADVFRFDADIPTQNVNGRLEGTTVPVPLQATGIAV